MANEWKKNKSSDHNQREIKRMLQQIDFDNESYFIFIGHEKETHIFRNCSIKTMEGMTDFLKKVIKDMKSEENGTN